MNWIPRLIGVAPFGVGLTLFGFLWLSPFNEFGSPPLFFRVFGSFVAFFFVLVGSMILFGPSLAQRQQGILRSLSQMSETMQRHKPQATPDRARSGYECPQCGAPAG